MAWFFEDEASDATWALLARLDTASAYVPGVWPLEVGNIMTVAERRRRTTATKVEAFVDQLACLPIRVDPETEAHALRETLALARAERLTTYDAAYLELAMRRDLPLATKDAALQRAAAKLGVELLPG